jgi:hypothetical protein
MKLQVLNADDKFVRYPGLESHPELGVLNYPEDIGEGFLRLSVGLEDSADLLVDLKQALDAIPA